MKITLIAVTLAALTICGCGQQAARLVLARIFAIVDNFRHTASCRL